MNLVVDRRGQSIQIGAVLLFGVLIIAFAGYQATVVPDQNSEVEFNHNQAVQNQMQDLRNAIVSVPGSTSTEAVSVTLSTQYPSRVVARNPGPPTGSLRTNGTTQSRYNITVRHAETGGETGDVWNGTPRAYNTGLVAYQPNYNIYRNAPMTYYDQSVVYNQFRTANITLSGQTVVDGRDITLVALNGSLQRSSGTSASVDVRPVSRSDDPIVVRNHTASSNVSVSMPTRLPEPLWEELLADEIDDDPGNLSNDRYVTDVTATDGPGPFYNLTITFERGADYRLRMAKAGVGTGVTDEPATYLTDISGNGTRVTNDTTAELVLEVRDEYNNPVQGVTVYGGVDPASDGSLLDARKESGTDGRVTFEYDATGVTPDTHQVNFSYRRLDGSFDRRAPENVTMDVVVTSSSGGSGGSGGGGVNAFSSTSVSDLQAGGSGLTQTVSFSPEDEAIASGETVFIDFSDAQQSSVNYENYQIANLPSGVSLEDSTVDSSTDTFTVTLIADNPIATSDTVTFDVENVQTDPGQAGPLDVSFTREDTGGSETTAFNVGGSSSTAPTIDSFTAGPGSSTTNRKYYVDYTVTDSDGDLTNVEAILENSGGQRLDSVTVTSSGTSQISETDRELRHGNNETPARVRLVATDAAGNSDEETRTV